MENLRHLRMLRQRKHLFSQEFRLLRHGVSVERGGFGSSVAGYTVPYESISIEPYVYQGPLYKVATIAITVGFAIAVWIYTPYSMWAYLAISFAILNVLAFLHSRKVKYIVFQVDRHYRVGLWDDSPSKSEVDKFIELMLEARAEYLSEKYKPMPQQFSTTNELLQLQFLKEQGAITEEEFLKIKDDLLKDITGDKKSPGFLN